MLSIVPANGAGGAGGFLVLVILLAILLVTVSILGSGYLAYRLARRTEYRHPLLAGVAGFVCSYICYVIVYQIFGFIVTFFTLGIPFGLLVFSLVVLDATAVVVSWLVGR